MRLPCSFENRSTATGYIETPETTGNNFIYGGDQKP
jgi:hypothetical protein